MRVSWAVCLALAMACGTGGADGKGEPSSAARRSSASAARQRVMTILSSLPKDGKMMAGQQLGMGAQAETNYARYVEALAGAASGAPAVIGVDYGWDRIEADQIRMANKVLLKHWKRGGLVTVIMDPGNPFTGGSCRDRRDVDFADLLKADSPAGKRFGADLARVADGLQELRDSGVAVIFRPLHEPNGDWFWWCPAKREPAGAAKDGYVALYRKVHNYLTKEKNLDNVLFAWAAMHRDRWGVVEPVDRYYPGDDVVDLVGLDLYDDEWDDKAFAGGADCRLVMQTQKPVVWEVGPRKVDDGSFDAARVVTALKRHCPGTAYFLFWNGWPKKGPLGIEFGYRKMALAEVSGAKAVMADPAVVTLEKMPEYRGDAAR